MEEEGDGNEGDDEKYDMRAAHDYGWEWTLRLCTIGGEVNERAVPAIELQGSRVMRVSVRAVASCR